MAADFSNAFEVLEKICAEFGPFDSAPVREYIISLPFPGRVNDRIIEQYLQHLPHCLASEMEGLYQTYSGNSTKGFIVTLSMRILYQELMMPGFCNIYVGKS